MVIFPYKTWWKPRFPMDYRPLVEFWHISRRFSVFQKNWVFGYSWLSHCGIGASICIGQEMLCLPYAGDKVCGVRDLFIMAHRKITMNYISIHSLIKKHYFLAVSNYICKLIGCGHLSMWYVIIKLFFNHGWGCIVDNT